MNVRRSLVRTEARAMTSSTATSVIACRAIQERHVWKVRTDKSLYMIQHLMNK